MAKETKETVVLAPYSDKEVVMRHGANTAMSNSTTVTIPVGVFLKIWDYDWNPGGRSDDDFISLYDEITTVGMNTRPVISCNVDADSLTNLTAAKAAKALLGLRGHLRSKVVANCKDKNPDRFDALWANGVVCEVVTGLSKEQQYYLACDHNTVPRDKVAIARQAVSMRKRGCTERDVILQLWDELATVFNPLQPKRITMIKAATTLADKIKEMVAARRGVVQLFSKFSQLPDKVFGAWENSEKGKEGAKISHSDVATLWTANKGGTVKSPTVGFEAAFDVCTAEYGKPKTTGPKPMNVNKLEELYLQIGSKTLQALYLKIRYSNEMDLEELDSLLLTLEQDGTIDVALFAEVDIIIADIISAGIKAKD